MSDDPYADFRDDEIPSNLMNVLTQLADELVAAEAEIERITTELEKANDNCREIKEHKIPNVAEGLEGEFKLKDGRTLLVKEEIRASIAGDKAVPAIKWIDDHDYGHIVKRQVIIEFGKDSEEEVKSLMKALKEHQASECVTLDIKIKDSVHHMTLLSWVKERLAEGENLPKDTFGIFHQKTARVKE